MIDKPKSKLEQLRETAEAAREAKRLRNLVPISEPHIPTKSSEGVETRKANPGRAKDNLGRESGLAKPLSPKREQPLTNLPSEAKPKFDRNQAHREYMKEYMRRRRQKEQKK